MSNLFDEAKEKAGEVADKAKDILSDNAAKVESGIDKAAEFIDDKTGNKHSDKIDSVVDKVKGAVDKLVTEDDAPAE